MLPVSNIIWPDLHNSSKALTSKSSGRGHTMPATDMAIATARAVYETNVFSVMALTSAFTPLLVPTRGLIINISSISSFVPLIFGSAYASSKAALNSYSRTLRQELRPFGVRVMVAMAGTVQSNIASGKKGVGLPEGSLYAKVSHLFEQRKGISQTVQSRPMETSAFARRLVDEALKGEVAPFWRSWLGRPDWFWCGGKSSVVYWSSWFGEWPFDFGTWRQSGLSELEAIVTQEDESCSDGKQD